MKNDRATWLTRFLVLINFAVVFFILQSPIGTPILMQDEIRNSSYFVPPAVGLVLGLIQTCLFGARTTINAWGMTLAAGFVVAFLFVWVAVTGASLHRTTSARSVAEDECCTTAKDSPPTRRDHGRDHHQHPKCGAKCCGPVVFRDSCRCVRGHRRPDQPRRPRHGIGRRWI